MILRQGRDDVRERAGRGGHLCWGVKGNGMVSPTVCSTTPDSLYKSILDRVLFLPTPWLPVILSISGYRSWARVKTFGSPIHLPTLGLTDFPSRKHVSWVGFGFLSPASTLCFTHVCWLGACGLSDVVVQSLSRVWPFVTPWTAACQVPLSPSVSQSLLKLCPLSQWCFLTILSSATPFSFCFHSFSPSGSFPMSQLFASGGQSIAASTSVLPINIPGWFPLGLIGLISLLSKGLSRVFSSTTVLSPWPSKIPEEEVLDLLTKILISFHDHPVGLWQKPYGVVLDLRILSRNLVGRFLPSREIPPVAVARLPQDVGMTILRVKVAGVLQQFLDVNCSACFCCVTCQTACPRWVPLFPPVHDLLKSSGTITFYDCLPAHYQGRGYPGGDSVTCKGFPNTGKNSPKPSTFRHMWGQSCGQACRGRMTAFYLVTPDAWPVSQVLGGSHNFSPRTAAVLLGFKPCSWGKYSICSRVDLLLLKTTQHTDLQFHRKPKVFSTGGHIPWIPCQEVFGNRRGCSGLSFTTGMCCLHGVATF